MKGKIYKWSVCIGLVISVSFLLISGAIAKKVTVTYWDKHTGFEGEIIRTLANDFNESQDKIYVKVVTISDIDVKILAAIAGGNPPDLFHADAMSSPYVMRGAIIPLTDYAKEAGIKEELYAPIAWKMMCLKGDLWVIPVDIYPFFLHYNKGMFEEAGLDPGKPPVTIEELGLYNEKLTKWDAEHHIIQMGFDPRWPGWTKETWGWWFGGKLYDPEDKKITANDPGNIRAYKWIASIAKRYGVENLQGFASGFGDFSTPTNPFLAGKIAMVLQGPWMANFIEHFAPKMKWGAAPFPYGQGGGPYTSKVEADVLAIPAGAKHPDEAFEFIKFSQTREAMEKFNLAGVWFPPLKVSLNDPNFMKKYPDPYTEFPSKLMMSANAHYLPNIPVISFYLKEMEVAHDEIMLGTITPREALEKVTLKVQRELDKYKGRF